MPRYKVPCFWEVGGYHIVDADTMEEAVDIVNSPEVELPPQEFYVEGSFEAELEFTEEVGDDYPTTT